MTGNINVDAMLRRITARQFRTWQHYYGLEPFGEMRADKRAASIERMIFNTAVVEDSRVMDLDRFGLQFEENEKSKTKKAPQTFEEQIAIAKIWCAVQAAQPEDIAK